MTETAKKALLPAYLCLGDDDAKKEVLLAKMKERVAALGEISINTDEFKGENHEVGRVISASLTLPFASEKRLVIVTDVDKYSNTEQATLAEYLAHPSDSTVLFLTATKLAKNTKLFKAASALDAKCVINCDSPKSYEFKNYVIQVIKSKGLKITNDAAETLVDRVGQNTVALNNEVTKLVNSHTTSDAITAAEIESLVAATAEVKPWILVDAFSAKNTSKVLELLPKVTGTTPTGLLMMCVNRVRELIAAKDCAKTGASLAEELGIPQAASWRVKNHANWARLWAEDELSAALKESLDAEASMKSGADPVETLRMWLITSMN